VIDVVSDDWIKGRSPSGQVGMIPAAYLGPPSEAGSSQPESPIVVEHVPPTRKTGKAVAKFKFESANAGDLAFDVGDIIELLEEVGDEWLEGRIGQREGLFPRAYVEIKEPL